MSASDLPLTFSEAVIEAELITAESASAAFVDAKRAEFDAAVEEHCMRFGFDAEVNS